LYKISGLVNKHLGGAPPPRLAGMTRESRRMRRIIVAFLIVAGALAWRGVSLLSRSIRNRA
jgi:hypothetical protein